MADIAEVVDALASLISQTVYPNGTDHPSIAAVPDKGANPADVIIYEGWPDANTLETDLSAGKVHISLYPRPGDTTSSVMMGDDEWQEIANDGVGGTSAREVRRQTRQIQITIWAPTPSARDLLAKPVDLALAVLSRFGLPDGSQATLAYVNSAQSDEQQKLTIYRRDLFYAASYAVVQTEDEFAIQHTLANVTTGSTSTATGPQVSRTSP